MEPTETSQFSITRSEVILVSLLMAFFLTLGTIGREPWKADEPYCVGIVLNMIQHNQWLIPHVGGDPFLEKPPLMFWSAALTAWLFSWALPFADAARLAVIGWMMLTMVAIVWAARSMYARQRGWFAVMLAFSSFGMWPYSHKLIPDVSQLAGATVALAAMVRFAAGAASPRRAGLLAGTGIGIAFLSKGLLMPGVYGLLAVLLPLIRRDFRTRSWIIMCGWAFLGALPWLSVWPALLYQSSPALFVTWIWENNIDRFLGIDHQGEEHPNRLIDIVTLITLTLPASALAVLALGQKFHRRKFGESLPAPAMVVVIYALILIATLEISASLRDVYYLPVYPAFALLGAGVAWSPGLTAWFRRSAIGLFGILAFLLIAIWALLLSGQDVRILAVISKWVSLDYLPPFQTIWMVLASIVTVCCLWALHRLRQFGPIGIWFAGATLVWGLGNSLWLPWIDNGKSYRRPFEELARTLPADSRCVSTIGLGESERAMLQYYTGRMPYLRDSVQRIDDCGMTIVMTKRELSTPSITEPGWILIWEGSRPSEHDRRFFVYQTVRRS